VPQAALCAASMTLNRYKFFADDFNEPTIQDRESRLMPTVNQFIKAVEITM
jgi:hypothetical protein